ncbi:hypothetical protein HOY80DRAFT_990302 [Tuber brumale]|nr:hypothetical protein HOY80DRAFT_990302 [Tuber brumale]
MNQSPMYLFPLFPTLTRVGSKLHSVYHTCRIQLPPLSHPSHSVKPLLRSPPPHTTFPPPSSCIFPFRLLTSPPSPPSEPKTAVLSYHRHEWTTRDCPFLSITLETPRARSSEAPRPIGALPYAFIRWIFLEVRLLILWSRQSGWFRETLYGAWCVFSFLASFSLSLSSSSYIDRQQRTSLSSPTVQLYLYFQPSQKYLLVPFLFSLPFLLTSLGSTCWARDALLFPGRGDWVRKGSDQMGHKMTRSYFYKLYSVIPPSHDTPREGPT